MVRTWRKEDMLIEAGRCRGQEGLIPCTDDDKYTFWNLAREAAHNGDRGSKGKAGRCNSGGKSYTSGVIALVGFSVLNLIFHRAVIELR